MPPAAPTELKHEGAGLGYATAAYGLWGFLPAYFLLLEPAGPFEVVAFRILMSLAFCVVLLAVTRAWRPFWALARQPRVLGIMAIAGVLIYINWQVFVIAVLNDQVVDASLGYFINPLVTVLLGVLVLRERLRTMQWVAVGISALAIIVIVLALGSFPWIALSLALSFGLYGFVKKRVGAQVDAVSGLTLETVLLTPVAAVQLGIVGATVGLSFGANGPWHAAAMVGSGVITAVPLLLFAAAARRLPLTLLGLTQYLAPILQLLFGVLILNEQMPVWRWVGFALVWVSLIILTIDGFAAARAARRVSAAPA